MSERIEPVKLRDGTLIRHKAAGYEGRIEGTTAIKTCFTAGGELLGVSTTKQTFQYRVVIKGESMRRVAPVEDLEILEGVEEVICFRCHTTFMTKPGLASKAGGRCQCGGWICPFCLACQDTKRSSLCTGERKRLLKKLTLEKKSRAG